MIGKRWSFEDSKRLARLYNNGKPVNEIIVDFPERTETSLHMKIRWLKRKGEITELRGLGPVKGTKFGYRIDAGDRPICPRCGYKYIQSAGHRWKCPKCERWWLKKYNWSMIMTYLGSVTSEGYRRVIYRKVIGPPCPRCGAEYPYSRDKSWKCIKCNRHYLKNPKYRWNKVGRSKKGT